MEDNSKIQTLKDFIRYGSTSTYTIPTSSYIRRFEDLIIHDKMAYEKYNDLIFGMSTVTTLTDDEMNVFKYRPDLFSYKMYGTPNLSHLILYLNKCAEYEFNKKRVRYITLDNIKEIFNLIMANESEGMKRYNKIAVR